jgi:hypothetical protein
MSLKKEGLGCYKSDVCSQILRSCWQKGAFWYLNALDSPTALPALFFNHIQPRFTKAPLASDRELMKYWRPDASKIVNAKIKEEEEYKSRVQQIFAAGEQNLVEEISKQSAQEDKN